MFQRPYQRRSSPILRTLHNQMISVLEPTIRTRRNLVTKKRRRFLNLSSNNPIQ